MLDPKKDTLYFAPPWICFPWYWELNGIEAKTGQGQEGQGDRITSGGT